jgi:hypothetical protein
MPLSNGSKADAAHPRPLHNSKSFSRIEPEDPGHPTRSQRASTVQDEAMPEIISSDQPSILKENKFSKMPQDSFDKSSEEDESHGAVEGAPEKLPADFDELPIELISLTDRSESPRTLRFCRY